jgi:mono/diheme cytochrome c family protein
MARSVLNVLLFLTFVASLGVYAVTGRDLRERNLEFMPEMAHSVAYQTYAPNPNFPDGKTLQAPEPGTIARGLLPFHYRATPEDAVRAGAELSNPFARAEERARQRGAFVYANYCRMCHGPQGKGDGPVPQHGVPLPPSLLADRPVQMKDGQLFHIITYGQGNMPATAGLLSREDRWQVILHLRSLQQEASGKKSS